MTGDIQERDSSDRNQNGQAMGRKGLQTRNRLIEATLAQLETTRLRDLRVSEIARQANLSTATFYVYFPDVTDAVLAVLEEITQGTPEILELIGGDWGEGDAEQRASRIVKSYADHWSRHHALFKVRNLAADEGDGRFRSAREFAIRAVLDSTGAAFERAQQAGWVSARLDSGATAGVLMAMLERFAAIQHNYSYSGIEREEMILSAAYILANMLGPPQKA
jgi:AcrR family transcriptional regulator